MKKLGKFLYLVTNRKRCNGKPLEKVVIDAVLGGVKMVQLREDPDFSRREFIKMALVLKKILRPFSVPLIINNDVGIALAVKADGVHIGQTDMPYFMARKLLGPKAIIGLSVDSWKDVEEAQMFDVDYIAASPVFPSRITKLDCKNQEGWGLDGLRKIREFSKHPVVAIGGINETNTRALLKAGADGIAVVGAICGAKNPGEASKKLHRIIMKQQERKEVGASTDYTIL